MKRFLVIVDMQHDFVDGALGSPEARQVVEPVTRLIREGKYDRVFATRDTHGENYLSTQEGKHLPVVHCVKETPGWQIVEPVAEALHKAGAVLVDKPTFGSFDLACRIKAASNPDGEGSEVIIAGLCTDICVVSNALILKAALPEARVLVVEPACAGVTPSSHRAALQTMTMCHVDVADNPDSVLAGM